MAPTSTKPVARSVASRYQSSYAETESHAVPDLGSGGTDRHDREL